MNDFNFHPEHTDPITFLNCEDTFQVTHTSFFSIENMSDRELREAILHDLIAVTMWEKQLKQTLHFGFTKLYRFLPKSMHKRVRRQMKHVEICNLISIQRSETSSELRIKDNRAILQAAMDYAGCWYNGFDMPKDVFRINHNRIEELGGIEAIVDLVANDILAQNMDDQANTPSTNTVN